MARRLTVRAGSSRARSESSDFLNEITDEVFAQYRRDQIGTILRQREAVRHNARIDKEVGRNEKEKQERRDWDKSRENNFADADSLTV